ncbi:hypothetical protein G6F57_007094 [Rhizopus arrhizus]|uniref:Nudix hydrolase domain-containing protein n=1 Tax=Rhizopus oryzae TaxID=64495 RepID=A0A9P6X853_RHIOR|nr:hypothetical protein G6F23_002061 [Rhizopus arrhizus]KAG1422690.1 hypothetical protein G6F58_003161 [Rhizopus delemar]KAG0762553.1 hypothetical protein G6F24_006719 [Rhizopus arrhizus]KAG0789054.1 hypothetical protein G6F21_006776 [Rhizopus arrhizus]KAG0801916.1 hypothetical protein G6F22_000774 [Rhizopus arrhizus]
MYSSAVFAKATFEEILDDLSSRFIINVPEAELASVERICFQHCPLLHQWAHEHERAYADFMQYRFRIPVCGAIILNSNLDKCVLVKGWSSKSGWGFPKGKINQEEEYDCCAIREVLEETGYDIGPLLKKTDYIELTMREQRIRLYIIQGVPEDTQFIPRTRKEISQISWIKLEDLPTYKTSEPRHGNAALNYVKSGSYRFYMVVPFVSKLKTFVNQRRKQLRKANEKAAKVVSSPRKPIQQQQPMTPSSSSPPSSDSSSDALKSLLGVMSEKRMPHGFPTASPAVSQPHPNHQPPPLSGNNLLQEIFSSASTTPQQPQQNMPFSFTIHGAEKSTVEKGSMMDELFKGNSNQQPNHLKPSTRQETVRRNSLLDALQGNNSRTESNFDPIQALFQGNVHTYSPRNQ